MRILLNSPPSFVGSPLYAQLAEWMAAHGDLAETVRHDGSMTLIPEHFDAVVACMSDADGQALAGELPARRLVIVPVFDTAPADAWWQQFQTHRFLAFGRGQHEQLLRAGLESAYFQPFPPLELTADLGAGAMLWEQAGSTWSSVMLAARQCLALGLTHLHVAWLADAGQAIGGDVFAPFARVGLDIHIGDGHRNFEEMAAIFARHAVIVLPGASLAGSPVLGLVMAMGRVILAPNVEAVSDYVGHGVSGLLYDPRAPLAAFADASLPGLPELAAGAQARAGRGYRRWIEDTERLISWLIDDGHRWSATDSAARFANLLRRRAGETAAARGAI